MFLYMVFSLGCTSPYNVMTMENYESYKMYTITTTNRYIYMYMTDIVRLKNM